MPFIRPLIFGPPQLKFLWFQLLLFPGKSRCNVFCHCRDRALIVGSRQVDDLPYGLVSPCGIAERASLMQIAFRRLRHTNAEISLILKSFRLFLNDFRLQFQLIKWLGLGVIGRCARSTTDAIDHRHFLRVNGWFKVVAASQAF
ncbi:Phosphoribosylaminoimidazole-succinocarboxamide synthase [Pseudomonas syringae pv. actinidiae]|uniref:Phosphoribosylaminoimidazole-succinocarboxamide synthase n=1 Tax=Pseudomonas syringae pv. actinidiae TaxID=103796 RepID=A0A2V0QFD1_PSESF|nr:Phosphoribosylaminoimidazole-succinocarboxamide synthase [Pseudomonas syringae pv. actinidiae]GBH18839.1 Phosphoribosylaminoimidazole-succinocarboxamide synthase [Pseudomonas syringae pv. actinidiae]